MPTNQYEQFLVLLRERKLLAASMSLLTWDEQVNLPVGAAEGRGEQISALSKVIHEKNTLPEYVELIQHLLSTNLNGDALVNVRETWRDVERQLRVPKSLVAEMSAAESETYNAWVEAKQKRSYALVRPQLKHLFELKRQYADCIRGERSEYDALLDVYEPGATTAEIEATFSTIAPELSKLIANSPAAKNSAARTKPFQGVFPQAAQAELCTEAARWFGFEFERGRLDTAMHPFCSDIGFGDIRMTTRYSESDFFRAFYGTLHETGHGLYELGYLPENRYTALADYCSMAIHESQSRLWENIIGRSREFLSFLYPHLQKTFPENFRNTSFEQLYAYVNWIGPSLVRVEADEVSYGLHVILRFELEKELFSGALSFDDLPEAWNASYKKYLNRVPEHEGDGVLQDVHWYSGNFGYFPTYLLGSAYAAQIFAAAKKDLPQLDQMMREGELMPLRHWLQEKIHRHGKRFVARDLMRQATGSDPSAEPYLSYLRKKYSS